jgi:hypothetical protein
MIKDSAKVSKTAAEVKKIIFISTGERDSFTVRTGKKIFYSKSTGFFQAAETVKIIIQEKPNFVLLDLEKPVNGNEDMMSMLSNYDSNIRLRVTFLEISLHQIIIYKILKNWLINLYNNFIHNNRNGKGMKEAFVRR